MTGACTRQTGVFPRLFTQGGGGQVKGDKAFLINGGTHESGHRPYGGT